jgi:AbrB family looped-hinge helix DNA binding protein
MFVTHGAAMTIHVKISPNGRMSLPADLRKRLGIAKGGSLLVEERPDGVMLRTVEQAIARAQEIARKHTDGKPGASVDDFLARRLAEWGE